MRNADLKEIIREFAPMLLNMAIKMKLAAKNETLTRRVEPRNVGKLGTAPKCSLY